MRVLSFRSDHPLLEASNQALRALGYEVCVIDLNGVELLDKDKGMSQITRTALDTAESRPDLVLSIDGVGLIPGIFESLRVPYAVWAALDVSQVDSFLEQTFLAEFADSDLLWIFCANEKAAREFQKRGYAQSRFLSREPSETVTDLQVKLGTLVDTVLSDDRAPSEEKKRAPVNNRLGSSCFLSLGQQLMFQGKWENAERIFRVCAKAPFSNDEALYHLVSILDWKGEREQVQSLLESHLDRLDADARDEARISRAQAYCNVGIGQENAGLIDKAAESYSKALRLDSKSFLAYNNLGAMLLRAGELDLAELNFLQAICIHNEYSPSYFNLALLYETRGDYEKAITAAEQFVELVPVDQEHLLASGRELLKRLYEESQQD